MAFFCLFSMYLNFMSTCEKKIDSVMVTNMRLVVFLVSLATFLFSEEFSKRPTPTEALHKLIEGNLRAIEDRIEHPNYFKESKMKSLLLKQEPFAIIVACSDSRVSPEILFDQGIGDLFVVRVAGNVVGPLELESIHYAVTQLKAPLIVVMGHENCGAVGAVLNNQDTLIPEISALIRPAIQSCECDKGNKLQNAVEANVKFVVTRLRNELFIQDAIKKGELDVIPTYYHLEKGQVRLIPE